jgi:hypothetical protein
MLHAAPRGHDRMHLPAPHLSQPLDRRKCGDYGIGHICSQSHIHSVYTTQINQNAEQPGH